MAALKVEQRSASHAPLFCIARIPFAAGSPASSSLQRRVRTAAAICAPVRPRARCGQPRRQAGSCCTGSASRLLREGHLHRSARLCETALRNLVALAEKRALRAHLLIFDRRKQLLGPMSSASGISPIIAGSVNGRLCFSPSLPRGGARAARFSCSELSRLVPVLNVM